MSDPKRAALTTLSTNKCDKKSVKIDRKSIRLTLNLIEPNEDSCSVFNFTALINAVEKKQQQKKKQQNSEGRVNGTVDPFENDDDEDVRRIAKQYEEKYGSGDKKKSRCQTYAELGAGYDDNDSFIDNTDACDDALPEDVQTVHGGYYINSGPLEFKRVELSDASDFEDIKAKRRKFGPNVIRDSDEEEAEEEDGDDEDDEEDEDEEEEDEATEKENGESEKAEEKAAEKEIETATAVKKMKVDMPDDVAEIVTKSDGVDESALIKKRKKAVAEKQQPPLLASPAPPIAAPALVNSSANTVNGTVNNYTAIVNDSSAAASPAVNNSCAKASPLPTLTPHHQHNSVTPVNNTPAGVRTSSKNRSKHHSSKKKTLTVKALLEEKRVQLYDTGSSVPCSNAGTEAVNGSKNHKSVNDVIEFVVSSGRDEESSKDSSSSAFKSHSDSDLSRSGDSSDSQTAKSQQPTTPSNNPSPKPVTEIPNLPDIIPLDVLDLVSHIKLLVHSQFPRKGFSGEVNSMLISLEKKIQNLCAPNRNMVYEHLACFVPFSKTTLTKRMKKLYFDSEEGKMNEPLRKLKAAIDSAMPALLEKYSKDCQKIASEKSADEPPSTEMSNTEDNKGSPDPKIPRRKFIWTDEMRLCVKELIRLALTCYHIKNPRRETSDQYTTSFLNSKVQPLWPPGWMKTSTLLREADSGTAQKLRKIRKQLPSQQQQQQLQMQSQSPLNQKPLQQPLQSLLNVSLPSSTTLTPTNGTANSNFKLTYDQSQPDRRPIKKPSPISISTTLSLITTTPSSVMSPAGVRSDASNGLTVTRVNTAPSVTMSGLSTAPSTPPTSHPKAAMSSSPSKKHSSVSPNHTHPNSSFSAHPITFNGSSVPFSRDFSTNTNSSTATMKVGGSNCGSGGVGPKDQKSAVSSVNSVSNSILDLSSGGCGSRTESGSAKPQLQVKSVIKNSVASNDRTSISGMSVGSVTSGGGGVSASVSISATNPSSVSGTSPASHQHQHQQHNQHHQHQPYQQHHQHHPLHTSTGVNTVSSTSPDVRTTSPSSHVAKSPQPLSQTSPVAKDHPRSSLSAPTTPTPQSPKSTTNTISPSGSQKQQQQTTPVRSLKHRILQDQVKQELAASVDDKPSFDDITSTSIKREPVSSPLPVTPAATAVLADIKKKIKTEPLPKTPKLQEVKVEVKSEPPLPPPSPVGIPQQVVVDYDQDMSYETVTATDILSQLISESLLGTPHKEEVVVTQPAEPSQDLKSLSRARQQRLPSSDQEAVKMEVNQVIQELAALRQMSGGGADEAQKNASSKLSTSSSLSSSSNAGDESKKRSVTSYQNEFYKHIMQKESSPPPPPPLSQASTPEKPAAKGLSNSGSGHKSETAEDIPNKYSPSSHHPVQSIFGSTTQAGVGHRSPVSSKSPISQVTTTQKPISPVSTTQKSTNQVSTTQKPISQVTTTQKPVSQVTTTQKQQIPVPTIRSASPSNNHSPQH